MSRITKQKYVYKEMEKQLPEPTETNYVVRVVGNRGNYLYEVENTSGENFLVTMPNKFRKTIYICRGNFIMVENIKEGKKVKAEITHVLLPEDIRYISAHCMLFDKTGNCNERLGLKNVVKERVNVYANGKWPKKFDDNPYLRPKDRHKLNCDKTECGQEDELLISDGYLENSGSSDNEDEETQSECSNEESEDSRE